jgi:hypothetical protein
MEKNMERVRIDPDSPGREKIQGTHRRVTVKHCKAADMLIYAVIGFMLFTLSLFSVPKVFAAGVINLPRTGQTKCYNESGTEIACAGTGQDGEIRAGAAWPNPRFTVGSGAMIECITDNLTGLMWATDANLFGGKKWSDAIDSANELELCGYSDWRLPNINELESLYNADERDNEVWLSNEGFIGVESSSFWSSTTVAGTAGSAKYVGFWYGHAFRENKESLLGVWPVRGQTGSLWRTGQTVSYRTGDDGDLRKGVQWPSPRFTDRGNGEVIDNLTGLIWTKNGTTPGPPSCTPGTWKTWQEALDYVKCLNAQNYLGHTDWRLPNRKELYSLVDYSQNLYTISLPSSHPFTNVQIQYWSSTTHAGYKSDAWIVDFWNAGYVNAAPKEVSYAVWPVGQVGHSVNLVISKPGNGAGTVVSSPSGIDCGETCAKLFDVGTEVTLTAPAETGSTFAGWSGCDSVSDNRCTVAMDWNRTVTANFDTDGGIRIGDLIVRADSVTHCTGCAEGVYDVTGNMTITNKNASSESAMLKVPTGTVRVDTTAGTISSSVGSGGELIVDHVPVFGSVGLGYGFSFLATGNTLTNTGTAFHIAGTSELVSRLFGFEADITSLSVDSDGVTLNGTLALPETIKNMLKSAEGDSIDIEITAIRISRTGGISVTVNETINISEIPIPGTPLTLKDITVIHNGNELTLSGGFEMARLFPTPSLSGGITLLNKRIDAVWIDVSDLNVPIDGSPFFLNEIGGSVSGIYSPPLILQAKASFSGGPQILNTFKLMCLNDVGVTVNVASSFTVSGSAGLFCAETPKLAEDGFIKAVLEEAGIYWDTPSRLAAKGKLTDPFDIIRMNANFTATSSDINGSATGEVCTPETCVPSGLCWFHIPEQCYTVGKAILNSKGIGGEITPFYWDNLAFFIDWAVVLSESRTEMLSHIRFGDNLEEVSSHAGLSLAPLSEKHPASSAVSLNVPPGLKTVIISLSWETGDSDFNLIAPDGTVITPAYASANPDTVVYMKLSKSAWYGIKNPTGGSWQAEVLNPEGIGAYTVRASFPNAPPAIEITSPSAKVTTSTTAEIAYTATDPEDIATISLFYDRDGQGADGIAIVRNLAENDGPGTYAWDVSNVPSGTYYVYAVIDDGRNAPVLKYSTGVIEVTHGSSLVPPANLQGAASGNQITLTWDAVASTKGYFLFYTDEVNSYVYGTKIALDDSFNEYTVKDLIPNREYRFTVSSFDAEGNESPPAAPVTITTGNVAVPVFGASPASLNFGTVPPGKTATRNITVSNTGGADLILTALDIRGMGSGSIAVQDTSVPVTIAAGGSLPLTLGLNGQNEGVIASTLTIETNDPLHKRNVIAITGILVGAFNLREGWNFISLPVQPEDPAIGTVLRDISAQVRIVWGYDGSTQLWQTYEPLKSQNTLTTMEAGKGYWIYMDSAATLIVTGSPSATPIHLYEQWNLIGHKGWDGVSVASMLSGIADKWKVLWSWDNGQWYMKDPVKPVPSESIQPLTIFNQGKAYWIKMKPGMASDLAE